MPEVNGLAERAHGKLAPCVYHYLEGDCVNILDPPPSTNVFKPLHPNTEREREREREREERGERERGEREIALFVSLIIYLSTLLLPMSIILIITYTFLSS